MWSSRRFQINFYINLYTNKSLNLSKYFLYLSICHSKQESLKLNLKVEMTKFEDPNFSSSVAWCRFPLLFTQHHTHCLRICNKKYFPRFQPLQTPNKKTKDGIVQYFQFESKIGWMFDNKLVIKLLKCMVSCPDKHYECLLKSYKNSHHWALLLPVVVLWMWKFSDIKYIIENTRKVWTF